MSRLVFFVSLLLASVASAAWDSAPGSGLGNCTFLKYQVCYADLSSSTTTGIINTHICENISAHWVANIASTAHTNTIQVRWSAADTESANTSEIVKNATLTGDPATDLDALYGFDAPFVYGDATIGAGTGRLALHCFRRRS